DGSPDYTMTAAEREFRGTDIILHVADDSLEFLEESRIGGVLEKYCRFLPVPIFFGETTEKVKDEAEVETEITTPKQINNPAPAWTKKPADLTDEDYKSFYRELYPMNFEDPLFWIHLNVDYPFNLTGVLYFPKIKKSFEMQKDKIQLYSNQVFVTDSVEQIVPDFLTLLRGVIDSPDIPLNVSRSYLQSDGNVKKISSHVTKKVADKLEELFKKDREDFEKKYEDIRIFIQYGMLSDDKFYDKAKKFALLRNAESKMFTLEEYETKIKPIQTDKEGKLVYLYTTDVNAQHSYIETAKDRGYDVLVMDSMIDSHYINFLESKLANSQFVRVDSDTVEKLIRKDEPMPSKLSDEEKDALRPIVEEQLPKEKFNVMFESLSETDAPMLITRPEFMRRMKDMSALGGGMNMFGNMPEMHNLVVNTNHPLVTRIVAEADVDAKKELIRQSADLALLAQGLLKGEELTKFIKRSVEMIK
ncbi:MAG TPA: molecular chaperone HtpG, partial [Bacteroidia bacterium]|nr:molecular chaperone HtpG [Bacteroidia bacterium]